MKITTSDDIVISCNAKKTLKKAMLFSVISLWGIIFFNFDSPNMTPLRQEMQQYGTYIVALISLFYWFRYFKSKQQFLLITSGDISWGEKRKTQCVEWSKVQSITVVDLATISRQTDTVYEFVMEDISSSLSTIPTLYINDYDIDTGKILKKTLTENDALTWKYWHKGVLRRKEVDRNADGAPDMWVHYRNGKTVKTEIDVNFDGKNIRLEGDLNKKSKTN